MISLTARNTEPPAAVASCSAGGRTPTRAPGTFRATEGQTLRTAGKAQPGDRRIAGVRLLRCALLASAIAAVAASSASAAGLSSQSFGINISHNDMPADLANGWPGSTGVGVARREVIEYSNPSWTSTTDQLVSQLAQAGLRLAPDLGLPCPSSYSSQTDCPMSASESVSSAANDMANYVTAFAQRYGPGGTFWKDNPGLPDLPVEQYEIGDEPNIPIQWIEDETHLHWGNSDGSANTADYAAVYEASRNALHNVGTCSGCEAVVGGLGDSGSDGVTLTQDEGILAAIPRGTVDAVAFHPYTWQTNDDFGAMESDVASLRQWMSSNGMASTPIEINEFDACSQAPPGNQGCYSNEVVSSSAWGAFTASYTTWALCTPGLNVQSVVPFIWGDTSDAPTEFQTLVDSSGNLTPYGQAFRSTATALTTTGCPPPPIPVVTPGTSTTPSVTVFVLPTAGLRILHIHVHGSHVTIEIQVTYGTHSVKAIAIKGRHRIRLHVIRRRHGRTLLTLTAKLFRGVWTIKVSSVPPSGYTAPPTRHHKVKIRR
jgi:hypothetical protein